MARKQMTQVAREDFLKVARYFELDIDERKGFIKCYAPGNGGRPPALGIPNTKQVTCVELVGFTHQLGVAHPKPPAKTVEQMMDFTKANEADILHDFMVLCQFVACSTASRRIATPEQMTAMAEEKRLERIAEFEAAYAAQQADEQADEPEAIEELEAAVG